MHCTKIGLLRSVQGQKRKSWPSSGTSVLPPIKDMQRPLRHVGFVPTTDIRFDLHQRSGSPRSA